ncbi:FAD-dependent oxidoreductase [Ruegeria pomeroyi]|uniref:FAD-dependent oxidoreductase n=1 Tax=Ruegeria alba TaxID=2916756 RepID=A0ABS9NZX3_9RHOB|nr:FAD-dependent oxidoreductase [Ruegeria alba]MCE8513664.1 FAD-dependent oxidoreductase [Ruegeria pomeroyi]MCE8519372.1 FAD-dependent oxidoreductase [Ruegeria pomeroyi]MCE8524495.1 FAD-dependent oxidoreductase [Ruegeria pomeroyi]MCE8528399.1 FAD-dependent oxidoreductase [Ruegeria pomeroyi]MCE8531773.1 FAD-dependent oxidoreductase [Ruegeria pomeroyi]
MMSNVCIIGAGLSGLALSTALRADGHDVTLLEARARAGGRILSQNGYDLGPSWIWPHNARMLALLDRLGLRVFAQHISGSLVFEDANGAVRRDLDFATMGGALRVVGGLAQVSQALAEALGDHLRLDCRVHSVREESDGVNVTTADGSTRFGHVVFALPPRLVAGLGPAVRDVPTWMAAHAKLVAIYPTPFWRHVGLNGDAISHRGPLAEIHDASPAGAEAGALFGFAHVGAARQPGFRAAAIAQLARLFGDEAAAPDEVLIKDWSCDPATATDADLTPPAGHPAYRALTPTRRLIFAGTEVAPKDGGFLEGALAAAEAARARLMLLANQRS